jgi:hypothetical protein
MCIGAGGRACFHQQLELKGVLDRKAGKEKKIQFLILVVAHNWLNQIFSPPWLLDPSFLAFPNYEEGILDPRLDPSNSSLHLHGNAP